VVVVTEGERLLALFPGFLVDANARLAELRLLAKKTFWSVEPLVDRDHPPGMVGLFARALSESSPPPARLVIECAPTQSKWPRDLRRQWAGGPAWLRRAPHGDSPLLLIEGPTSSEGWLSGMPGHWRREFLRRMKRRAEAGLEVLRTDTPEAVRADVHALAQLHQARLNWQSGWLTQGVEDAIVEAGRSLVSTSDFRLWKVVSGEQVIGAALFARASDVSEMLLTAFDPAWSRLAPGLAAVVAGIRHELDTGVRLIDFGYGDRPYLQRLSNAEYPIIRYELYPTNLRTPIARARWSHTRDRVRLRTRLRALRDQGRN
jgi:hypothetical protein